MSRVVITGCDRCGAKKETQGSDLVLGFEEVYRDGTTVLLCTSCIEEYTEWAEQSNRLRHEVFETWIKAGPIDNEE